MGRPIFCPAPILNKSSDFLCPALKLLCYAVEYIKRHSKRRRAYGICTGAAARTDGPPGRSAGGGPQEEGADQIPQAEKKAAGEAAHRPGSGGGSSLLAVSPPGGRGAGHPGQLYRRAGDHAGHRGLRVGHGDGDPRRLLQGGCPGDGGNFRGPLCRGGPGGEGGPALSGGPRRGPDRPGPVPAERAPGPAGLQRPGRRPAPRRQSGGGGAAGPRPAGGPGVPGDAHRGHCGPVGDDPHPALSVR